VKRILFNLLAALSLVPFVFLITEMLVLSRYSYGPSGPQYNFSTEIAIFGHWTPVWMVLVATAILPVLWLMMWSRNFLYPRARPGLCVSCGYDLRATPERCPECGTVPLRQEAKGAKSAKGRKGGEDF
jgi:predicted RNA-binding Zn-ribbon protein involved in translation (DUF1610 family)